MELKAYAKINWDLHILGKREDGFHAIDTVMVNVSLFDTLRFEEAQSISMTCSDPALPTDERNLVIRAAQLLARTAGIRAGARIDLAKHIPAGGGMGGGSSDAATTLMGLNKLWKLNWPVERLQELAAHLGSDIAFFLYGGWCHCHGRGEIVERVPGSESFPVQNVRLILPPLHVSTPQVYKILQAPPLSAKRALRSLTSVSQQLKSVLINKHNGNEAGITLHNDLTIAARVVEPQLVALQAFLQDNFPARWLMSGSGAVHFVLCSEDAGRKLDRLGSEVISGTRVLTATTLTP